MSWADYGWVDLPAELDPIDGEDVEDWTARIAAYIAANPGALKPQSAANLEAFGEHVYDKATTDAATAANTALTAHTGDTSGAHAATAISFTPNGTIAATTVQAAIQEVRDEAGSGSSGHTIEDEGTPLTDRATLNFTGAGVSVTDSGSKTVVSISGAGVADADASTKGVIQLAGDLTGTAASPQIAALAVGTAELAANAVTAAKVAADVATQAELDAVAAAAQPLDSDLTAIAALTTTSYGRAFLALADAAAGRTALSLGTAATQATGAFEASGAVATHEADTTSVHGITNTALLALKPTLTTKTADYTFALADAFNKVYLSGATPRSFTVPPNASVAFAVGDEIEVGQLGAGALTIVAGAAVTVDVHADFTLVLNGAGSVASLLKTATNTWLLTGQLVPA